MNKQLKKDVVIKLDEASDHELFVTKRAELAYEQMIQNLSGSLGSLKQRFMRLEDACGGLGTDGATRLHEALIKLEIEGEREALVQAIKIDHEVLELLNLGGKMYRVKEES